MMQWTSTFQLLLSAMVVATLTSAFTASSSPLAARSSAAARTKMMGSSADTPEILPEFANVEEYLEYMGTVSKLPLGFATGTADGGFISVEAPALGKLKIRATVIKLTDGPTENWAACFTSNKVSSEILPCNIIMEWAV